MPSKSSGTVKPRVILISGRTICKSAVENTSSAWNLPPWVKPFAGIFITVILLIGWIGFFCHYTTSGPALHGPGRKKAADRLSLCGPPPGGKRFNAPSGGLCTARAPVTVQHLTADSLARRQIFLLALPVLVLALLQQAPGRTGLVAALAVVGTMGLTGATWAVPPLCRLPRYSAGKARNLSYSGYVCVKNRSTGAHEGGKDLTAVLADFPGEFRVPLHGPDKPLARLVTASTRPSGAVAMAVSPGARVWMAW